MTDGMIHLDPLLEEWIRRHAPGADLAARLDLVQRIMAILGVDASRVVVELRGRDS